MLEITYDLHLHSCLSPCGDDNMTPANIAGMAAVIGLDAIALTDHNTCKNCSVFLECAENYGLIALPGMELTTMEEIHVLCYFSNLRDAMSFDDYVEKRMMPIPNRPKIFGNQYLMNEEDEIIGEYGTLLISATDITFTEVFSLVDSFGGIAVPAHIEKTSTSMLSTLGTVPPDSGFHLVEAFKEDNISTLINKHKYLQECSFITSSDAHSLQGMQEPEYKLSVEEKSREGLFKRLNELNHYMA